MKTTTGMIENADLNSTQKLNVESLQRKNRKVKRHIQARETILWLAPALHIIIHDRTKFKKEVFNNV